MPFAATPPLETAITHGQPVDSIAGERVVEPVESILQLRSRRSPADRPDDEIQYLGDAELFGILLQPPTGGLAAQPPQAVRDQFHRRSRCVTRPTPLKPLIPAQAIDAMSRCGLIRKYGRTEATMGDIDAALQRISAVISDYERTGESSDLLEADLSWEQQVLHEQVTGRGKWLRAAHALASLHWYRYLNLPGLDGLRERLAAIELFRLVHHKDPGLVPQPIRDECRASGRPETDARSPDLLSVLLSREQADRISQLVHRYQTGGELKALRMLINVYQEWLPQAERERDWPRILLYPAILTDLTRATVALAEETGDGLTYNESLEIAGKALRVTPAEDPQVIHRLKHVGEILEMHFDGGAGSKALELAVARYRSAAQLAWHRSPADLNCVAQFGVALCRLYEVGQGPVEILLEALSTWRDVVRATVPDSPKALAWHHMLTEVDDRLAEITGWDLVREILTAADDPVRIERWFLGVEGLAEQVEADSSPQVPADLLESAYLLVAAVPAYHPGRPRALLLLADAELSRWERGGEPEGAVRAATWAQCALHATLPEHPLRVRALTLLAHAATTAALHESSESLVRTGVNAAREALKLTAGLPGERARQLDALAGALLAAAEVTDQVDFVEEAVRHQREVLTLTTPADHGLYSLRLTHLSTMLVHLDMSKPDGALLDEAVEAARLAVEALPPGDFRRVGLLYNQASSLVRWGTRRNEAAPLLEGERVFHEALALLPPGHADHPRIRSSIAEALYGQYTINGDIDALSRAVALARQAVHETPQGHHWWPLRAGILARAASDLARMNGPDADRARDEAMTTYAALAASPVASAGTRVDAERRQAELAQEAAEPVARLAALERAVQKIPNSVARSLAGPERLEAVAALGGLGAEAASAAITAGDPERAVELLERSRALLFNEALGVRSGWVRLLETDPRLAAELDRIDEQLSTADFYTHIAGFTIEVQRVSGSGEILAESSEQWDPRPSWRARTLELSGERDRLIQRVRALPGLSDFLRTPSLSALRRATRGMRIVMINTHAERSDALLIPAEPERPIESIRLPGVSEAAIREKAIRVHAAVADATDMALSFDRRISAQEELHGILEWLWDTVAGPVLDRIAPAGEQPPRIAWCPVGALARLPLHAAGHHREPAPSRTVFDRAISSYTPTVSALAHAVNHPPPPPRKAATAVIVGVPTAENTPALPQAHAEVEQVARLIPGSVVLTGSEVGLEAVEGALRTHPLAHFACHGEANASRAALMRGGLSLGGGVKLSPGMVRSYRLEHAELAFLSACSTAETHPTFTDEPLHLASAFQLAGFRSVIGTMWRTTDSSHIARAFYSALTAGGTKPPTPAAAAAVLNETLRALRDEYPATPTRWAAHLHVGL
ncbi:CHAT domain-containing protein [Streptosporangium canum]|uniref:CHAT domain-containing protein n=1 Tax=Streptosporangium canum TaxID=324952 RepID=UPI00343A7513